MIIITCGAKKATKQCAAWRMYQGGHFRAQWEWARSVAEVGNIRILSAKYGLLRPTDKIEPYELRMGNPGSITIERLAEQLPPGAAIVITAGKQYLSRLEPAIQLVGGTIDAPFNRCGGMGYKAQAMKRATRKNNVLAHH